MSIFFIIVMIALRWGWPASRWCSWFFSVSKRNEDHKTVTTIEGDEYDRDNDEKNQCRSHIFLHVMNCLHLITTNDFQLS